MSREQANGIRQYARFWRWHFYAAFLVIPFVLWQGTTGVIYLWHEDIADALWPQFRKVAPASETVSLDTQLAAATQAHGEALPATVQLSADPGRSTQWVFKQEGSELSSVSFVDPHTGRLLGTVSADTWLPGLTRKLHGGWPLGKAGSWLLELGAGWCIVMVLTGVYLWWPRQARGLAGVLYPRLRAGSRIFWRDLHSVVGLWFAGIFLVFLFTALPWTDFWGNQVLKPFQRATGQTAPKGLGFGHEGHNHAHDGMIMPLSLQTAFESARAEGVDGDLEITVKPGNGPLVFTSKRNRAASERVLQIDRSSGAVLTRVGWNNFPFIPKVVATGVDLHEGTFFGRANQVFNTLTVTAFFWLIFTGLIGWYRRRPGKGLGAPPRPLIVWPRWVKVSAIGLCLFLPLLGMSVLLLWIVDRAQAKLVA